MDSAALRQNVQRALNRGENYHQLRRAVSYANFGKLRFTTEDEQQLWSECSRLMTTCIIFYNAMILSRLFARKEASRDTAGMGLIMQVSCHLKIDRQADRSGPVLRLPAPIYNGTTDWIAANDREPCLTTLI